MSISARLLFDSGTYRDQEGECATSLPFRLAHQATLGARTHPELSCENDTSPNRLSPASLAFDDHAVGEPPA